MSETRNAYVERQKENISQWNLEIDKYQVKAEKVSANMVDKYQKQIEELKVKRTGLEEKISEIEKSVEAGWEDLKIGAEKAFKALDKSFKNAKSRFN